MYDGRGNEDLDVSVISTATGLFELSFILHQLDSRRQSKSVSQVQVVSSEWKPEMSPFFKPPVKMSVRSR